MIPRQIDFIQNNISESFSQVESLSQLKNEKIYITGASGFMGCWLLEAINYLNKNHSFNTTVIALAPQMSNMKTKFPHLASSKLIEFINYDVRNPFQIPNDVTWVIHAAASPDNRVHSSNPIQVVETIIRGTTNTLEAATLLPNLKKFLNISSGLVYGKNTSFKPTCENEFQSLNPSSMTASYSESKRMAETLCFIYKSQYRMPIVNTRPFAFIGPYQSLDRPWAINNFINDAINGNSIKILGNEDTVRSYMYSSDMSYWILSTLVNGQVGANYNLGSDESKTLKEVAQEIQNNFGSNTGTIISPARSSFKSYFVPNISKSKNDLKLSLTKDFKETIRNTINWYKLEK